MTELRSRRWVSGTSLLSCTIALAPLTGCESRDGAEVGPERASPRPSAAALVEPTASSVPEAPPPPPEPPTLGLVRMYEKELDGPAALHAVDGAWLLAVEHRVARVTDAGVEWVGSIPDKTPGLGDNVIDWVGGSYPDAIDVTFSTTNGRAPTPTYWPLTGEGHASTFAMGGGAGWVSGVAPVGGSVLLAGFSFAEGHRILTVRGPKLKRTPTTLKQAGCTEKEVPPAALMPAPPAVEPYFFGSSPDGTVFAVGSLCRERGPAVEIWGPDEETSKIVEIGKWVDDVDFFTKILVGSGGAVWLVTGKESPILAYAKGGFSPLPKLGTKPRMSAFVSDDGALHASDGDTMFRYEDEAWRVVARHAWFTKLDAITLQKGVYWATTGGGLYSLKKRKSLAYHDGCETPFVYLYDVSPKSEPTYTFPTTRKALSTFEGAEDLTLMDFHETVRRLGIPVPSSEVGEAVMAHIKANMKDEDPKLLCYAPEKPREIVVKPKPTPK